MDLFIFLLMALTVISVNENRRLGFLQWLSHLSPSVVCLQETHAVSSADLQSWFSGFGFLCAGFLVRFTLVGLLFCIGRFLSVGLWCANLMAFCSG